MEKNKLSAEQSLKRLENSKVTKENEKNKIKNKLKNALTEKMIIDGLIKKQLLNENQII